MNFELGTPCDVIRVATNQQSTRESMLMFNQHLLSAARATTCLEMHTYIHPRCRPSAA